MPEAPDAHTEADRRFHDETAHLYDDHLAAVFGVYARAATERLIDGIRPPGGNGTALDVGCGTGAVGLYLAGLGLDVTGIDHSAGLLAQAERKAEAAGVSDRITFVESDIRPLPFADDSFDVVTCQGVLHHLEDLPGMVREMARVMRPGGGLYLADPCLGSNLGLRLWTRAHRAAARRGADGVHEAHAEEHPELDEAALEHEEGPIEPGVVVGAIESAGLEATVEYMSEYPGLSTWPRPMQVPMLRLLSFPWRRRSGNMIFVTARGRDVSPATSYTRK